MPHLSRPSAFTPVLVLASALTLASTPPGAAAQIATDRPDFVESSATVGSGAVQVETSMAFGRTGSGALRQAAWTTPTLLRVGISHVVELRLETDGWIRDDSAPGLSTANGLADIAVGLKWHTSDEGDGRPATAILFHADLPSGAAAYRGDGVRPSVRAVAEWTLPGGLALGLMPGLILDRTDDASYAAGLVGAVVGLELTANLRTFAEVSFDQIAAEKHGGSQGTFNTGLALLLSPSAQLDTGLSWGLTDGAPDFSVAVGLSVLRSGD